MKPSVTLLTVWVGIACDSDGGKHINKEAECFKE